MGVRQYYRRSQGRTRERGTSLFLGLFAVLIIAGYILVNVNVDRDRMVEERVDQTAWLIQQISEAARLYVRDQNIAGTAAFQKIALCTTPRAITINELIANGYIGSTVGERNVTGTNYITPLNQTVLIIAANSEITPTNCTAAQLSNVAATAFVVLQPPSNGVENLTLAALAESLSRRSMPVGSPIFDGGGNNISEPCVSGPATIQWDTGCLDNSQFSFLTGGLSFAESFMGIPTWLTFRGDNRALFRYEQAENPAASQMQTDLIMAGILNNDPDTCTQLTYTAPDESQLATNPTASRTLNSGVCVVQDDTGVANNRHNIVNVGGVVANRALVVPQAIDNGAADSANDFNASGNTVINGGVRAYNASNAIQMGNVNFIGSNQSLTITSRDASAIAPRIQLDDVTAGLVQADTASVTDTSVAGDSAILNRLTLSGGSLAVNDSGGAGRGVVINNLSGTTTTASVSGNAILGGTASAAGPVTINGGTALPVAAVRLNTNDLQVRNDITVGRSLSVGGTTDTTISSVGECIGDCPDRSPEPGPPLP